MAKKDFFLIIDTETTQDQLVADFGAVICDRKGKVYAQCAVLVNGVFTDMENHPLFFDSSLGPDALWSKSGADRRYETYNRMIEGGSRMVASIGAINRWLDKALSEYNPILTAYNLAFDLDKCEKTGIDLTGFTKRFCLWGASVDKWGTSKKFQNFVMAVHAFNPPTKLGNMTYKTNAEIMARFVLNMPNLADEPHTALEDIIDYELPILTRLVNTQKKEKWMNPTGYNWRDFQVKDHFTAK